jgi:hypothetical protein
MPKACLETLTSIRGGIVLVKFNEAMSCQVRQFSEDVSASQGRYLDLKLHPEQAAELPEAKEWPALGAFIGAVNKCDGFRTSGCMVAGNTPGGHPAPYVDIYLDNHATRVSPSAVQKLVSALKELNDRTIMPTFVLELCNAAARLPDGKNIVSLRLWFIGTRADAEKAFALIVTKLGAQKITDYIPIAAQERRERKKSAIRLAILILGWLTVVGLCAFMASRYGWLLCIAAAIGAVVLYPIIVIGLLLILMPKRRQS